MDRLVAGTGDPYADQAVGDIAAHAASVVVDHDRELRVQNNVILHAAALYCRVVNGRVRYCGFNDDDS